MTDLASSSRVVATDPRRAERSINLAARDTAQFLLTTLDVTETHELSPAFMQRTVKATVTALAALVSDANPAQCCRANAEARRHQTTDLALIIYEMDDRSSRRAEPAERDRHQPGAEHLLESIDQAGEVLGDGENALDDLVLDFTLVMHADLLEPLTRHHAVGADEPQRPGEHKGVIYACGIERVPHHSMASFVMAQVRRF